MADLKDDDGMPPVNPPEPTAAPPAGASRWPRWLLIASLALNFVIVGLVAGAGIDRWKHGPRMTDVREVNFGPFNAALSPEDRDVLRKSFAERVGAGMRLRLENRQDFNAFIAALRAEPFDAEAVKTVFGAMRDRNIERLAVGEELLLERITAMSAEDRAAFADRVQAGMRRGGGRDGKGGRDRQGE